MVEDMGELVPSFRLCAEKLTTSTAWDYRFARFGQFLSCVSCVCVCVCVCVCLCLCVCVCVCVCV